MYDWVAMPLVLWAAEVTEALSGGSGWFGAGLLGLVLGWLLLRHLPAKDAQLEWLIAGHAKERDDRDKIRAQTEKEQRAEYKETIQTVVNHCHVEMERLDAGEERRHAEMQASFRELSAAIAEMRKAVAEDRDARRKA